MKREPKNGRLQAATFKEDSGFYKCFEWKNKRTRTAKCQKKFIN